MISSPDEETGRGQDHLGHSLGPNNECCFCLTLPVGSIFVAIINFIANIALFSIFMCYESNNDDMITTILWPVIVVGTLLFASSCTDITLARFSRSPTKSKAIIACIAWLIVNAVTILFKAVVLGRLLVRGRLKSNMGDGEYSSILAILGLAVGYHIFTYMVIYQFRKNLREEVLLSQNNILASVAGLVNAQNDQPSHSAYNTAHGSEGNSLDATPSAPPLGPPPPSYEEVIKSDAGIKLKIASPSHYSEKSADSPPPDYSAAFEKGQQQ